MKSFNLTVIDHYARRENELGNDGKKEEKILMLLLSMLNLHTFNSSNLYGSVNVQFTQVPY